MGYTNTLIYPYITKVVAVILQEEVSELYAGELDKWFSSLWWGTVPPVYNNAQYFHGFDRK